MNKVNYFEALARLRQIIPTGLSDISLQALHSPDIIDRALNNSNSSLIELPLHSDSLELNLHNALSQLNAELYVTSDQTYLCHVDIFKDLDIVKNRILSEETIIVSKEQPRILIFHHEFKLFFVNTDYSREELESPEELAFTLREQQLITKVKAWQYIPKEYVCEIQSLLSNPIQKLRAIKRIRHVMDLELVEARDLVDNLKPWWPVEVSNN